MRENIVKTIWQRGGMAINGWLLINSSYAAEVLANQAYDCITVDLQHGMIDFPSALTMLQAISSKSPVPLVRTPGNDLWMINKLLDAGAYGIICPLIETGEECERFVAACRYPPRGKRSFGPVRGVLYGGVDYFQHADSTILTLAMIETRRGLDNIDEIMQIPGLDAVFVGPSDLAISMGYAMGSETTTPALVEALDLVLAKAKEYGIKTGIFSSSGQRAAQMRDKGFDMVTPGFDEQLLVSAAQAAIAAVR